MGSMVISRKLLFMVAAVVAAATASAGDHSGQASGNSADSAPARQAAAGAAPQSGAGKGSGAKALELPGLDGARHSLADWHGKVIVINFWATWCSPCLYEIPDLVAYQQQYQARGLQIVGVGLDEEKKLRNVQRTLEINYPVLVADPAGNRGMMKSWGNDNGIVPYSVVIDRSGRVVYTHYGLFDEETFNQNVLPLLEKV